MSKLDPAQFRAVWLAVYNDGGRIKDIAGLIGVTPATVSTMATKLRKQGIMLPKFPRGRRARGHN